MKIVNTKKLFYKKYAYKIELRVAKSHCIKMWGVDSTVELCNQHLAGNRKFLFKHTTDEDVEKLKDFVVAARKFLESDIKTRAEYSTFNFYLDNKKDFNKIVKKLSPWIRTVTRPENDKELSTLVDNTKVVLCNKLPLKKYKYRLFINRRMPLHLRENFIKWTENYGDAIRITGVSLRWFRGGWGYDPFIYVEDPKLLLMVKMSLGEYTLKTEEFIDRNTVK